MKGIFQTDKYLICAETAAMELAQKEQAVILAISDSHGKTETLQFILEEFASKCDMIAFCGDGASDMILNLELARKNRKFAKNFPAVTAIVQGNGDDNLFPVNFSHSLMPKKKADSELFIPKIISAKVAGKNILLTHGLPPSFALIKIPGDNEKVSCTFYEIKVSLSQGIFFEPFSPVMRHW